MTLRELNHSIDGQMRLLAAKAMEMAQAHCDISEDGSSSCVSYHGIRPFLYCAGLRSSFCDQQCRFVRSSASKAVLRRAFSDAAAAPTVMKLNLVTPHASIYTEKAVDKVTLPGEMGEYGITMNHSPIISQLRPGVVQIIHQGVRTQAEALFPFRLLHSASSSSFPVCPEERMHVSING